MVSIVTINYNDNIGLKKTLESIKNQSNTNFELILIDGGSTDGSVETINHYKSIISYFVSEKDNGIYHAMNKGIAKASREYIFFLNSGDYFYDHQVLENISNNLGDTDHVCGKMFWENNNGVREEYIYQNANPNFEYFFSFTIPHQAVFSKKSLFSQFGDFDESLRICADWKFLLLTIIKHKSSFKYIDAIVSVRSRGGISTKPENIEVIDNERENVLRSEFPEHFEAYYDLKKYRYLNSSKIMKFLKKMGLFKYLPK